MNPAISPAVQETQQEGAIPGTPSPTVRLKVEVLAGIKEDIALLEGYVREVLEPGVDWGVVPGVPQPFLWEPGADKIAAAYLCYARPVPLKEEIDEDQRLITYLMGAEVLSRESNSVQAWGVGVASTREKKYGKRWVDNPQDYGYDPGTLPQRTRDGVTEWRIPNPEWGDLVHTLAQMAYKRAVVDAVQHLPGVSSALRRLFGGKQAIAWARFWAEMNSLGLSHEEVHRRLGVASLKTGWVEQGRSLAEARQRILASVGACPGQPYADGWTGKS